MLFVNVFIALSLLESAYSGVIMGHQNVADIDLDMDLFVDLDDILKQMEEDGESMLEVMLEEDGEAMLEDAERVERSRLFNAVPVANFIVRVEALGFPRHAAILSLQPPAFPVNGALNARTVFQVVKETSDRLLNANAEYYDEENRKL